MDFFEYASNKGVRLLADDVRWLRSVALKIPKSQRKRVLQRYVETWCQCMDECDNELKSMNLGRSAANNYIREQATCLTE